MYVYVLYLTAVDVSVHPPCDRDADLPGNLAVCQYSVGDQFYTPLDIDFGQRGNYIGYYFCYIVSNIVLTILGARFLTFRYSKR